jgi:hypothetical protein
MEMISYRYVDNGKEDNYFKSVRRIVDMAADGFLRREYGKFVLDK